MPKLLPGKLQLVRMERGFGLREAAQVTGLTMETLSELERGLRNPHPRTLYKISQGYGVPVHELLEEPVPLAEAPQESGRPEVSEEERRDTTDAFSDDKAPGTPPIALDSLLALRNRAERQREKHDALYKQYEESMPDPDWVWEIGAAIQGLENDGAAAALEYQGLAAPGWRAEQLNLERALNDLRILYKQARELASQRESAVRYGGVKAGTEAEEILRAGENAEREG